MFCDDIRKMRQGCERSVLLHIGSAIPISLVKGLGMKVNSMTWRWEREMFCDGIRKMRQGCERSVLLRVGTVIPMSLVKGLRVYA